MPDHLGSPVATTNSAGTLTSTQKYWPYGATRSGSVTQTDKLYTGQQSEPNDTALGLYDYGARFYSTVLGRFASVDPVVGHVYDPQSWNPYTYVRNNPLRFTDPSGEMWTDGGGGGCDTACQWSSAASAYQAAGAASWVTSSTLQVEASGCDTACQWTTAANVYAEAAQQQLVGALQYVAAQNAAALAWTSAVAQGAGPSTPSGGGDWGFGDVVGGLSSGGAFAYDHFGRPAGAVVVVALDVNAALSLTTAAVGVDVTAIQYAGGGFELGTAAECLSCAFAGAVIGGVIGYGAGLSMTTPMRVQGNANGSLAGALHDALGGGSERPIVPQQTELEPNINAGRSWLRLKDDTGWALGVVRNAAGFN